MEKVSRALVAGGAAAPASSSCTVAESRYLRHVSAKESLRYLFRLHATNLEEHESSILPSY